MTLSWPLRDRRWRGSRPIPISAPLPLLALGRGTERKKGGGFCCLAWDQAPCAARIAGRGIQAADGRLAYGWKPHISKRIRDEVINAIIKEWIGRLRGQALFTPGTAPTCFGKDRFRPPPKGGWKRSCRPSLKGRVGEAAPFPLKGGSGCGRAACPSRGRWEKLRRSPLKGGSGCGRCRLPLTG